MNKKEFYKKWAAEYNKNKEYINFDKHKKGINDKK